MLDMLELVPTVQDHPDAVDLVVPNTTNGVEIVFDNVNFAYDPRRPILRDLTFTVPPGQTFAIVGR